MITILTTDWLLHFWHFCALEQFPITICCNNLLEFPLKAISFPAQPFNGIFPLHNNKMMMQTISPTYDQDEDFS